MRAPRGPVWGPHEPSGDLFWDNLDFFPHSLGLALWCGRWGLRNRGADAPIPVRVRLLPVDDDAEPLGDMHDYHQALL